MLQDAPKEPQKELMAPEATQEVQKNTDKQEVQKNTNNLSNEEQLRQIPNVSDQPQQSSKTQITTEETP